MTHLHRSFPLSKFTWALFPVVLGLMLLAHAQPKNAPSTIPAPIRTHHFSSLFQASRDERPSYHVDISEDGKTVAMVLGSQLVSVNLETGKPYFHQVLPALAGSNLDYYWMAFSPNSQWLAHSAKGGKVLFLNPRTGKTQHNLQIKGEVAQFFFSPDGSFLLTLNTFNAAEIWNLHTFKKVRTLSAEQFPWSFTTDSQQVLTNDFEEDLRLVSIATGQSSPLLTLNDPAIRYQFSPDGKMLATADVKLPQGTPVKVDPRSFVSVWDTRTHKRRAHFALTGAGRIDRLLFAGGGRLLVAGTQNGLIAVWDLQHKKILRSFHAHREPIIDLELHQNRLFSAAGMGEIKIWNFVQLSNP